MARSSTYSTYSTVELTVPSRAAGSCRARLISGAPGLHTTLLCSRQARHAIATACAPPLPLARRDTRTGARWPRREQGERAFTVHRAAPRRTHGGTRSPRNGAVVSRDGVRLLNWRLIRGSSNVYEARLGPGRRRRRGATPPRPASGAGRDPACCQKMHGRPHTRRVRRRRPETGPRPLARPLAATLYSGEGRAQAFLPFPLTAGGQVPLAAGSGLQYSSMASVSIEKLTQWNPVQTMQKSLRMNLST